MCHNEELDRKFAYKPQKRFFWKKTTATVSVAVTKKSCMEAPVYSPAAATAPSSLSMCQDSTVGQKVVISADAAFAAGATGAGTRSHLQQRQDVMDGSKHVL